MNDNVLQCFLMSNAQLPSVSTTISGGLLSFICTMSSKSGEQLHEQWHKLVEVYSVPAIIVCAVHLKMMFIGHFRQIHKRDAVEQFDVEIL